MNNEEPVTVNDVIDQNDDLFKYNFIQGVSNQGLGILIVDMHDRQSLFVPFQHVGYLDEYYKSDILSNQVLEYFNKNEPLPNYMYLGIILYGELHIMSRSLDIDDDINEYLSQQNTNVEYGY